MSGPSSGACMSIATISLAALLAGCAPIASSPTSEEPSAAVAIATRAPASPGAVATLSPSLGAVPVYTWVRGSIDDPEARTEISDVFVLPPAGLAVERRLDGDTVRRLLRSENGSDWTAARLPVRGFVFEGGAVVDDELTAIGHVGDASRPARQIWTTTDGLAWTKIKQVEPMRFGFPGGLHDLAKGTSGWMAQAYEIIDPETSQQHVFFSPDRRSWRELALPSHTITTIGSNGADFAYIGVVIATTEQPTMAWTSSDGETWTSHPFPGLPQYDSAMAIAGIGGGFAVTGQHFVIETEASQPLGWWSSDGTSWDPASFAGLSGPAGEAAPREIVESPVGLIATGNGDPLANALWTTDDGQAWTQVAPLPDEGADDVAFNRWPDGRVVLFTRSRHEEPVVWLGTAGR